jgi:hypothetical protein
VCSALDPDDLLVAHFKLAVHLNVWLAQVAPFTFLLLLPLLLLLLLLLLQVWLNRPQGGAARACLRDARGGAQALR